MSVADNLQEVRQITLHQNENAFDAVSTLSQSHHCRRTQRSYTEDPRNTRASDVQNSGKKSNFFFVTPNFFGRGTWRPPNLPRVLFCDGGDIIQIAKKNPTEKYYFIMEKSSFKNKFVSRKNQTFQKMSNLR